MEKNQKAMTDTIPIIDMSKEQFEYSQRPLGKAIYKHNIGRPKKEITEKALPTDRIKCDLCGKEYFRSGSYNHKKTVFHQEKLKVNKKLVKLLIED
jgi:hypothetical protein